MPYWFKDFILNSVLQCALQKKRRKTQKEVEYSTMHAIVEQARPVK